MNFLKNYIRFANSENSITFEKQYEQITERTQTMGLEELILTMERKRGEKRGVKQVIINMLRKNLSDEMIADFANVPVDYVQKIRTSLK